MIDIVIFVLQIIKFVIVLLGVASVILMGLIVIADFSQQVELNSIQIPRRRVGRHRRTIQRSIVQYYDEISEWVKDVRVEKAQWRKEKEQVARGGGFFDGFYTPSFSTEGIREYPVRLVKKYHRKLDELVDIKIFDSTEVI
jgi:hypothetical protein